MPWKELFHAFIKTRFSSYFFIVSHGKKNLSFFLGARTTVLKKISNEYFYLLVDFLPKCQLIPSVHPPLQRMNMVAT